jgi:hypothetical protein
MILGGKDCFACLLWYALNQRFDLLQHKKLAFRSMANNSSCAKSGFKPNKLIIFFAKTEKM